MLLFSRMSQGCFTSLVQLDFEISKLDLDLKL